MLLGPPQRDFGPAALCVIKCSVALHGLFAAFPLPAAFHDVDQTAQAVREKLCDDQVSNFFVGKMSGKGSDLTISMTLRLATDISVSK